MAHKIFGRQNTSGQESSQTSDSASGSSIGSNNGQHLESSHSEEAQVQAIKQSLDIFQPSLEQKLNARINGPEDVDIVQMIGSGGFGKVFVVRQKTTHEIFAMKVLSKREVIRTKASAHLKEERQVMAYTTKARIPFVVHLKRAFETVSDLFFVMDYMPGGDLFHHIQQHGRLPEADAKFYISKVVVALFYPHKLSIIYRDLKNENSFLDAEGHVALCDFGLSKQIKGHSTMSFCATPDYMEPEVVGQEYLYNHLADFWSLGLLMYDLCFGDSLFGSDDIDRVYK